MRACVPGGVGLVTLASLRGLCSVVGTPPSRIDIPGRSAIRPPTWHVECPVFCGHTRGRVYQDVASAASPCEEYGT